MDIPEILPDELLAGYRGRLAARNNLASVFKVNVAVAKKFPAGWPAAQGLTTFTHNLANALVMDLKDLLNAHSMWPLFAAFPDLVRDPHWDYCSPQFSNVWLRLARPALAICEACVAHELETLHFSYWHRSHQLPGLLHCPHHGGELKFISPDHNAFLNVRPDEFLVSGNIQPPSREAHLEKLPVPAATLALMQEILRRPATRPRALICEELCECMFKFTDADTKLNAVDRLTSLVKSSAYSSWLDALMPRTGWGKVRSREWGMFDGVVNKRSSSMSAAAVALSASLVIPSHVERIRVLFG